MKKNIFLILFITLFLSACYLYPDLEASNNKPHDPFEKNPRTGLPYLPPGFGPSRGPSIKPRNSQYPADYFNSPPFSSSNSPLLPRNF